MYAKLSDMQANGLFPSLEFYSEEKLALIKQQQHKFHLSHFMSVA